MTTLTATRAATLPRVNLLPPEIAEEARFRKLKLVLGLVILATVLVVGLLWFLARGQSQAAANDLTAAQAQNAQLQAQAQKYANVPAVYAEVAKAESQVVVAMTPEVRWSFYLNDLSLMIPDNVRLVSLTASEPFATSIGTGTVATTTGVEGATGIGTLTYTGKATSADAVASWLQVQNHEPGVTEPWPSSLNNPVDGTTAKPVWDWSSTSTVTADALSHRYDKWGK